MLSDGNGTRTDRDTRSTTARSGGTQFADVVLVHWPQDATERLSYRHAMVPVLFLVERGASPPVDTEDLEDWVLTDADSVEVHARVTALLARVRRRQLPAPTLEPNGVLRVGARWVALGPIDARIAAVFVRHLNEVVETAVLEKAGWDVPPGNTGIRVRLTRLRRALEPLGLTIRNVRSRGYALLWVESSNAE